jgi:hypothetical protein
MTHATAGGGTCDASVSRRLRGILIIAMRSLPRPPPVSAPALGALLLLVAALLSPSARATSIRGPVDVAALTAASHLILQARVASTTSHWAAGGPSSGQIFTTVELEPNELWKGSAPTGLIRILVPGGAVDDLAQDVAGVATFAPGEQVVVFLVRRAPATSRAPAVYEVARWAFGKFRVEPAQAGAAPDSSAPTSTALRARRDPSGLRCLGCEPREPDDWSLDELRARVLKLVAGPGKGTAR